MSRLFLALPLLSITGCDCSGCFPPGRIMEWWEWVAVIIACAALPEIRGVIAGKR